MLISLHNYRIPGGVSLFPEIQQHNVCSIFGSCTSVHGVELYFTSHLSDLKHLWGRPAGMLQINALSVQAMPNSFWFFYLFSIHLMQMLCNHWVFTPTCRIWDKNVFKSVLMYIRWTEGNLVISQFWPASFCPLRFSLTDSASSWLRSR